MKTLKMKHSRYDDDEEEDEEDEEDEEERDNPQRQEKLRKIDDELSRLNLNEWFVLLVRDLLCSDGADIPCIRKARKELISMGDAGIDVALLIAERFNFHLSPVSYIVDVRYSSMSRPRHAEESFSFDVFPLSAGSMLKLWQSDRAGPNFFWAFLSKRPEKVVRDFGEHKDQLDHLESINFMLSESSIVRILQHQGFQSARPCILSWLTSARAYDRKFNGEETLRNCQNALGVKLLIKEGHDPNLIFDIRKRLNNGSIVQKGCALVVAKNVTVVDALLEHGANLDVLCSCSSFPLPVVFRRLLQRKQLDMKKFFPAKLVLERVAADFLWKDMKEGWLECVQILREFDYTIVEEDWKRLANPDLESAFLTFEYLKKRRVNGKVWWRPHTHFLFPYDFQKNVLLATFVLMQIRPRLPKELRKKILVMIFGREKNEEDEDWDFYYCS